MNDQINQNNATLSFTKASVFLMALLFVMAASSLFSLYIFADEMSVFADYYREDLLLNSAFQGAMALMSQLGRPISGFFYYMYDDLLEQGRSGLFTLRLITILLFVAGALVFLQCLRRLGLSAFEGVVLTSLLWSTPAISVYAFYAFLAPYWIGIFCAFSSFIIFYSHRNQKMGFFEGFSHLFLFGLALCTFQSTPFTICGLIAYGILMDRQSDFVVRSIIYLALLGTMVGLYTLAFKLGTLYFGMGSYGIAQELMGGSISIFNLSYFSAFEIWTYPILTPALGPAVKIGLQISVAAAWLTIAALAYRVDLKSNDRHVSLRWTIALLTCGAAFLPIVAAQGDPRQHLQIGVAIALVLIGYASILKLTGGELGRRLSVFCFGVTCIAVFGAAIGGWRGIVAPYNALLEQTGAAILAEHEAATVSRDVLYVILRNHENGGTGKTVGEMLCTHEPCTAFFGRRYPGPWHESRAGYYQIAALMAGAPTAFEVRFVELVKDPNSKMILNMNTIKMPTANRKSLR